jgi:DNA-binding PadR family transcriptional regulator
VALHHAVLALLARGPSHGYELRAAFDEAVGPQWGPLNIGHIYQLLDRLTRDGLVTAEVHPQDNRPDRTVHRITPTGTAELQRWLSEPAARSRGYRDDFFLKLLAATTTGQPPGTAEAVIARQRRQLLQDLRDLHADPGVLDAVEEGEVGGEVEFGGDPDQGAAELHLTADLTLLDRVEPAITQLAAAATPSVGVDDAPADSSRSRRTG